MQQHCPHDLLFRGIFCVPERAAELLRWALPEPVASRVRWSTLRSLDPNIVFDDLQERRIDLRFQTDLFDTPTPLLAILEHQSTSEPRMLLRALVYESGAWDRWRGENDRAQKIPPMIFVVFSHAPGGWREPTRLRDWIDSVPGLQGYGTPNLDLIVWDLHQQSDHAIQASDTHAVTKVTLLLLKHGREEDLIDRLQSWIELLRAVLQTEGGRRAFSLQVRYILRVNKVTRDALMSQLAPPLGREAGDIIMTEAERLIALGEERGEKRGEKRGIKLGEKRGEKRALLRQFERKLGRALTKKEQSTVQVRLDSMGPDRLEEVVLDFPPKDLADWLADPEAT